MTEKTLMKIATILLFSVGVALGAVLDRKGAPTALVVGWTALVGLVTGVLATVLTESGKGGDR